MNNYKTNVAPCGSQRQLKSSRFLREAESKSWTYHELIHEILTYETQCRERKNIEKLMKWAEFPEHLTFDQFDLEEQSAIGEKQLSVLKELLD